MNAIKIYESCDVSKEKNDQYAACDLYANA